MKVNSGDEVRLEEGYEGTINLMVGGQVIAQYFPGSDSWAAVRYVASYVGMKRKGGKDMGPVSFAPKNRPEAS